MKWIKKNPCKSDWFIFLSLSYCELFMVEFRRLLLSSYRNTTVSKLFSVEASYISFLFYRWSYGILAWEILTFGKENKIFCGLAPLIICSCYKYILA